MVERSLSYPIEAVGQLWLMRLPDGEPRPLTSAEPAAFQLTPDWSPDGSWITYVTWQDGLGATYGGSVPGVENLNVLPATRGHI